MAKGKPNKNKVPPQAQQIDYGQLIAQANEAGRAQFRDALAASIEAYPQQEALQLGTIGRVAENLRNFYTTRSDAALGNTDQQVAKLVQSGDNIGNIAPESLEIARNAKTFSAGPTALDQRLFQLGASAMNQRADQVQGARVADIAPMQAARLGNVAAVRSQNIEASDAEQALMSQAQGRGLLGQLEQQASTDLALGRALSLEQERSAQQAARAGMAARGLGVGNAAIAAEVLNRETFASQRENDRRNFAGQVLNQGTGLRQMAADVELRRRDANAGRGLQTSLANQSADLTLGLRRGDFSQAANAANFAAAQDRAMAEAGYGQQANLSNQDINQRQIEMNRAFLQNVNQNLINSEISRGGYALGALGQTANLYGQQGGAYFNSGNLGINVANQYLTNDPYMRAFAPGTSIGGGTLSTGANMVGNIYNNTNQMAGNTAVFNANMLDSRYNTWANNKAALEAARLTSGAASNAGWMSMLGGLAQGAGALGGGYLAGR